MKLHTYLTFNGQAEEAVLFYAEAFNTKEPRILKFGDMPANPNMPPIPEEAKDLVLHTEISVAGVTIKMSDAMPNTPVVMGNNVQVALTFPNYAELEFVYSALGEDADVIIPLGPSFFAEQYVYFTDKFGVLWHLMVEKKQNA